MTAPISVLCLLLTAGTLLGLDPEQAQYKREYGKFTNSPETTFKVAFRMACSAKCTAMKSWFCGGFTHHDNGNCDLYKGNTAATCVNPLVAAPPLEVDTSSEPRSYRRLVHSTCPGTVSAPCGCPALFSRCAGRCLALLTRKFNHADAEAACAELGAHLAVPRSNSENNCALDMAAGNLFVFIGATNLITNGTFIGADGTCGPVPANKAWWGTWLGLVQPNNWNGNEHCTALWDGTDWHDVSCFDSLKPLCQLRDCYRPQCP